MAITNDLIAKWRAIGPANMGGRIDDLAVVESDPRIIYAGSAAGYLVQHKPDGPRAFVNYIDRTEDPNCKTTGAYGYVSYFLTGENRLSP